SDVAGEVEQFGQLETDFRVGTAGEQGGSVRFDRRQHLPLVLQLAGFRQQFRRGRQSFQLLGEQLVDRQRPGPCWRGPIVGCRLRGRIVCRIGRVRIPLPRFKIQASLAARLDQSLALAQQQLPP
ncbi:MAG: hypothetical protein ACK559_16280, partial [bacterium]